MYGVGGLTLFKLDCIDIASEIVILLSGDSSSSRKLNDCVALKHTAGLELTDGTPVFSFLNFVFGTVIASLSPSDLLERFSFESLLDPSYELFLTLYPTAVVYLILLLTGMPVFVLAIFIVCMRAGFPT